MKTHDEEINMREAVIAFAEAKKKIVEYELAKSEAEKKILEYRRALAEKTGMPYAANRLDEMIGELL